MPALQVIILGAGIGGLTAALGLRRQGHHVTLLEKSPALQEAGAATFLGPNCSGILHRLGMKPADQGANLLTGMAQWFGYSGDARQKLDLTEVNKQWDNPWFLTHRRDLHQELKTFALDPDGQGPAAELFLGCIAVEMDIDKGTVKLDDGRIFTGDVIIGADGNHSFTRKQINPDVKPFLWGKSCFRWLIERDKLMADPDMRDFLPGEGWFGEVSEADRRFVLYPCRNNTLINFAAFVPNGEVEAARTEEGTGEDWDEQGNRSTVLRAFENFFPAAKKLLSYAPDDVKMWHLLDMEVLPSWTEKHAALIGDAAHPFIPFLGQGAAMAIEDATSIVRVLTPDTTIAEIPDRLKLYERIRYERVNWILQQTKINGMDEDKRPATQGGYVMLVYCHNHDEWENSDEKLREWLSERQSTSGV